MRVEQRLRINAAVTFTSAIALLAVLLLTANYVNRAMETAKIADAIIVASYERLILRTDSHRTGSERSKVQLIAKHKQVGGLLKIAAEKFTDPADKKTISELLAIHESTGKLSRTIREYQEKRRALADPDAFPREIENRLTRQLDMMIYETILLDSKLQESGKVAVISSLKLAGGGTLAVLMLVSAVILINTRIMSREIADRVARLRDGASVIGSGDLDHRIDIKGDDEFADVAEAFNAMTAKLSGSYRDLENEIEERKRAEDELQRSREDLDRAQEVGQIGSWRLDVRSNVLTWSNENHRIFGVPGETPLSYETFLGAIHPDDRQYVDSQWMAGLAGEPYDIEHRIVVDGQVKWVREKAYLEFDEAGSLLGGFGITQDITERKHAERALELAHDELARQVEERTRELHEKEVLLKEIHHRVKNNLQVISSLVSLQSDGSRDETVREVLRDVTSRVRSMALVHEKLYQSSDLARIDFAEYTRGLLSYFWRAHGDVAANVRLTLDLEAVTLPVDTAVPSGLILNELAGNALKHAFRGRTEGEVTVSLKDAGGRICLSVADNGVGLPPGLDWRKAGSLGLRLVQMLSGQLGADVDVCSAAGTRFEISFSLKAGADLDSGDR